VGAFAVNFSTNAQKTFTGLQQTRSINIEDLLGLDQDKLELRIRGFARLARRHRFLFGYLTMNRDATAVLLDEQIEFDDSVFPIGAETTSLFNTEVIELGYDYSFLKTSRHELGFSAGINVFNFEYGLSGMGYVTRPDGSVSSGFVEERDTLWAPVPDVGLEYGYGIASKWFLRSHLRVFNYSVSDWTARLLDATGHLEAYPWRHVGFGLGYSLLEIFYKEKDEGELRLDYAFSGWSLYVSIVR